MDSCVEKITESDFENTDFWKLKDPKCTFVLFYAEWCGHCQNLKPTYERFADAAQFLRVCATDSDAIIQKLNEDVNSPVKIKGFPTIVKYNKQNPVGYVEKRDYSGLMSEAMDLCDEDCDC